MSLIKAPRAPTQNTDIVFLSGMVGSKTLYGRNSFIKSGIAFPASVIAGWHVSYRVAVLQFRHALVNSVLRSTFKFCLVCPFIDLIGRQV